MRSMSECRVYRAARSSVSSARTARSSAGQALQNFNLMFGLDEATGLEQVSLFP